MATTIIEKQASAGHPQVVTQMVVFKLGGEEYGLPIDQIREVVTTPQITRMPRTPPFIRGLANIRGSIITVMDLEHKFEMHEASAGDKNFTLVIASEDFHVGILVREVPDTLSVSSADIESAIFSGNSGNASYITGIAKTGKRLIILLDIIKLLNDDLQSAAPGAPEIHPEANE